MSNSRWLDHMGIAVAVACGLHCAMLTLAFLLWPALWLNRRYWEMGLWQKMLWLEWTFLALTWIFVASAMLTGYLKHRRLGPAALALPALGTMSVVILTALHFSGYWATSAVLLAGLGIASAHIWNIRLCHRAHGRSG